MQNTTNFNLYKPEYTDTADIKKISDNMDTIDEHLLDWTKTKDLGTQGTLAALQTALDTAVSGMAFGEVKPVRFYTGVNYDPFKTAVYVGYLYCNYSSGARIDMSVIFTSALGDAVFVARSNGTWSVNKIPAVYNALDQTVAGYALDATQGAALSGRVAKFEGVEIASGTNLNTLTTAGHYYSSTSVVTNSLSNCPVSDQGFSMIVQKVGGNYHQIIFSVKQIYTRIYSSGSWNNWFEFAPIRMAINSTSDSRANLNDVTEPGEYYVQTSAIAATLVNSPVTNRGFVLKVYKINNTTVQHILTPSAMYTRQSGTNWSSWYKYEGTAV